MGHGKTKLESVGDKASELFDEGKKIVEDKVEEVQLNNLQEDLLTKKLVELEEKQKKTLDPMVAQLNTVDLNKNLSEQNELQKVLVDILPAFMLEMCIRAKMKGDVENGNLVGDLPKLLNQIEAVYPQAIRSVSDQAVIEFLKKMQTNGSTTLGLSFIEQVKVSKQAAEEMYDGVMTELEKVKNNERGSAEVGEAKDKEEAPVVDSKKNEDNSMMGWVKENPGKTAAILGVSGLALGYGAPRLWNWAFSHKQEVEEAVPSQTSRLETGSNWGVLRSIVKVGGVSAVAAFLFGKVLGAEFVKDYVAKDLTEETWAQVLIEFSEGRFLEAIFCMAKGANPNRERYIDLAKSWNVDSLVFRGLEDRTVEELVADKNLKQSMLDLWPLKYFDGYVNDEHKIRAQLVKLAKIHSGKKGMKLGEFLRNMEVLSSIRTKQIVTDLDNPNPPDTPEGKQVDKFQMENKEYAAEHESLVQEAEKDKVILTEDSKQIFLGHLKQIESKLEVLSDVDVNPVESLLEDWSKVFGTAEVDEITDPELKEAQEKVISDFKERAKGDTKEVFAYLRSEIGRMRKEVESLPSDGNTAMTDNQKASYKQLLTDKDDFYQYAVRLPQSVRIQRIAEWEMDEAGTRPNELVEDVKEVGSLVGTSLALVTGTGFVYRFFVEKKEDGTYNWLYASAIPAVGYAGYNVFRGGVTSGFLHGLWKFQTGLVIGPFRATKAVARFSLKNGGGMMRKLLDVPPAGMDLWDAYKAGEVSFDGFGKLVKGQKLGFESFGKKKLPKNIFGDVKYDDLYRVLADSQSVVSDTDEKLLKLAIEDLFGGFRDKKVWKYKTGVSNLDLHSALSLIANDPKLARFFIVNKDSGLVRRMFNLGITTVSRELTGLAGFMQTYDKVVKGGGDVDEFLKLLATDQKIVERLLSDGGVRLVKLSEATDPLGYLQKGMWLEKLRDSGNGLKNVFLVEFLEKYKHVLTLPDDNGKSLKLLEDFFQSYGVKGLEALGREVEWMELLYLKPSDVNMTLAELRKSRPLAKAIAGGADELKKYLVAFENPELRLPVLTKFDNVMIPGLDLLKTEEFFKKFVVIHGDLLSKLPEAEVKAILQNLSQFKKGGKWLMNNVLDSRIVSGEQVVKAIPRIEEVADLLAQVSNVDKDLIRSVKIRAIQNQDFFEIVREMKVKDAANLQAGAELKKLLALNDDAIKVVGSKVVNMNSVRNWANLWQEFDDLHLIDNTTVLRNSFGTITELDAKPALKTFLNTYGSEIDKLPKKHQDELVKMFKGLTDIEIDELMKSPELAKYLKSRSVVTLARFPRVVGLYRWLVSGGRLMKGVTFVGALVHILDAYDAYDRKSEFLDSEGNSRNDLATEALDDQAFAKMLNLPMEYFLYQLSLSSVATGVLPVTALWLLTDRMVKETTEKRVAWARTVDDWQEFGNSDKMTFLRSLEKLDLRLNRNTEDLAPKVTDGVLSSIGVIDQEDVDFADKGSRMAIWESFYNLLKEKADGGLQKYDAKDKQLFMQWVSYRTADEFDVQITDVQAVFDEAFLLIGMVKSGELEKIPEIKVIQKDGQAKRDFSEFATVAKQLRRKQMDDLDSSGAKANNQYEYKNSLAVQLQFGQKLFEIKMADLLKEEAGNGKYEEFLNKYNAKYEKLVAESFVGGKDGKLEPKKLSLLVAKIQNLNANLLDAFLAAEDGTLDSRDAKNRPYVHRDLLAWNDISDSEFEAICGKYLN